MVALGNGNPSHAISFQNGGKVQKLISFTAVGKQQRDIVGADAPKIAMHGLGLYIYAGEDLPEAEKKEPNPEVLAQISACADVAALTALFKSLPVDARGLHMDAFTTRKKELA